jgi:Heterokaryon incompatibility protein (HET)
LLDIGPTDDTGLTDDLWRLHITAEDVARSFDYLTLSYRWGSADFMKLTKSSMASFRMGKPISSLSRTFRDAITVARRFSIRYLWIDSLCIVQDSILDWQEQSALMRDVFTNSACNLAAADSHGPDEGLFRNQDPSFLMSLELQAELENRNANILL